MTLKHADVEPVEEENEVTAMVHYDDKHDMVFIV